MALLTIDEPYVAKARRLNTLLALGFRPFYLLAALFAVISVPLWIARYFGWSPIFPNIGVSWHMHEMVFGFSVAVIIGFVYTAARNWTGLWTPRGTHLALLAGLWLAGRAAMLAATPVLAAAVDLLFIPCATYPLYIVMSRAGNRRNMFLVALLGILMLANLAFHAANIGLWQVSPMRSVQAAILVVVMIESVIGGRVMPGFTANGAPGSKPASRLPVDRAALLLSGLAGISWVLDLWPAVIAALAIGAAVAHSVRLSGWQPHRTWRQPMLWILHLSYAWIAIGFFLLGLSAFQVVSPSSAFHALAVGSMAGLMLGMITRTALGHTGRPLRSGRLEIAMYALIQLGALARVCAEVPAGGTRDAALLIAAAFWVGAFGLYIVKYGPYLCRPRVDGREG